VAQLLRPLCVGCLMSMTRIAAAALSCVVASSGAALALPDLTPQIDQVEMLAGQTVGSGDVAEGCAAATSGRTLLRFGVRFYNVGQDSLVIGDPQCPDCTTNPGVVCGDPRFLCSPADGHGHPHYEGFATYELFDVAGRRLAVGGKRSFCIRESACPPGTSAIFTCDFQGIQPGCFDYYARTLGCQYIDATDVPAVQTRALRLRVTLDTAQTLPDANRMNNRYEVALPGCGDGIVQAGETCDPGPGPTIPCCDPACCHGGCL
jgi:Lysyl oxidase